MTVHLHDFQTVTQWPDVLAQCAIIKSARNTKRGDNK